MAFLAAALRDHGELERICQAVYFPTDPVALGRLTTMHGLIYYILLEYKHSEDAFLDEFDATTYIVLAQRNFHIGLETYDVLNTPTYDNISALILGVC